MDYLSKRIIATIVLASFIMIAVFGFTMMMHMADGQAAFDCPFSPMGQSLCPQNVVAIAIHHISAYQSFLSVYIGMNLTVLLLSLISVICLAFVVLIYSSLFDPPAFVRVFHNTPIVGSQDRKIVRWLSLFENSPSFI